MRNLDDSVLSCTKCSCPSISKTKTMTISIFCFVFIGGVIGISIYSAHRIVEGASLDASTNGLSRTRTPCVTLLTWERMQSTVIEIMWKSVTQS